MEFWVFVFSSLGGYLAGSLPTGFLVARLRGIDIRVVGSGNIGATNAFRVLGKSAGSFVLLVDALKGYLPAQYLPALATSLFGVARSGVASREYLEIVAGMAAILGHNYPCWLRFKGGKGIATSAGVLLAWVPYGLGAVLAVWIFVLAAGRYVSLASITAAALLPVAVWLINGSPRFTAIGAVIGGLAIYKHRANMRRLRNGTEPRIFSGSGSAKGKGSPL